MRSLVAKCLPLLLVPALLPVGADDTGTVPGSARDVQPIEVGATIPAVTLRDPDGTPVALQAAIAEQPTVLIFYRGGW